MFKDRSAEGSAEQAGAGMGAGAAVAQLSHAQALPVGPRLANLAARYRTWCQAAEDRLDSITLAPDLAQNIGSREWLRGAATLVGLCAVSLALWPDIQPLKAAPAMAIDNAARDEFRSQMIMPLALGADSGRHMGATSAVSRLANAPERPRLDLEATLAQGDSFSRMLERAGVGSAEAQQVSSMVAGAMALSDIAAGTRVDITLGRRASPNVPRPLDALSFRARFDLQLAVARQDGRLALVPKPIHVDATPLRVRGRVGPSLYRSARAAGAPAEAVQQYLRTLSAEIDLDSGISADDEFDMVVEYKRAATGEVESGRLLYAGVVRDGRPRKQLVRWGADGRFFEASGVGESSQGLLAPVPGRVTSNYGLRRHPILGYSRMHRGMDFKAGYGTPIYAVTDGRVNYAGRHGGHGNFVRLTHGGGLQTGYAHMSRISVSPGQSVRRGQVIGYVGSTGLSTGPHLHYEMYSNGASINPATVRYVTRAQLSGAELAAFKARLRSLQSVTPGAALQSLVPAAGAASEPVREIDRLASAPASPRKG